MGQIIKGRVWKFGDDLQGDYHLIPYPLIREIFDPKQLAQHCLVNVDPDFPKKALPGDVVVAGRNFGCGVTHPHTFMGFKGLGITLIIADTVSRETLAAHALQEGLAIMEAPGVSQMAETGDQIEANLATGSVRNLTTGKTLQGKPLPAVFLERLEAGGLIPFLRKRLAEVQRDPAQKELMR